MIATVITAMVVCGYLYVMLDDEIRKFVERKLSDHYPMLVVRVESAQLLEGRGISIRGLSIAERVAGGAAEPMVTVDELFVVCLTDLDKLLQNQVHARQLIVRRPRLLATQHPDGTWDVSRLLPLPKLSDRSPETVVEDGTLEISRAGTAAPEPLLLDEMNLRIQPQPADEASPSGTQWVVVEGSLRGEVVERVEVGGRLSRDGSLWQLAGTAAGLQIGPQLRRALPIQLAEKLPAAGSLHAHASASFTVDRDTTRTPAMTFSVTSQLVHGRIRHPRLPDEWTDVSARVQLDNELLSVEDLTARSGPSTVRLHSYRQSLRSDGQAEVRLDLRPLHVDRRLIATLPDSLHSIWPKFQPEGTVTAALKLSYDGQRWHPQGVIRLVDMSIIADAFPYRVDRATGQLDLKDDLLTVTVDAYSGEQLVKIRGELVDPGQQMAGWMQITARDLPVDDKLFSALQDNGRELVASFQPSGSVHLQWDWRRDNHTAAMPTWELLMVPNHCSILYEKFPYPLANVQGQIIYSDGVWTFQELSGKNGSGIVTVSGESRPVPEGHRLDLQLTGTDIQLDDQLHDALAPGAQRVFAQLRPQGRIDIEKATVAHTTGQAEPDLQVQVKPRGETMSIEPLHFPYRFDQLQGTATYDNGVLRFHQMRARHGDSTWHANGHGIASEESGWELKFNQLDVDWIEADRDLMVALPAGLRNAVSRLNPSGPVNLSGSFGMAKGPQDHLPVQSEWNMLVDCHQTDFDCGVLLEKVSGSVRVAGSSNGEAVRNDIELGIESLTYEGIQLTDVGGPLWSDGRRVLLGSNATRHRGEPPRNIRARLFGGKVEGSGEVQLDDQPRYIVQASLAGGDLGRFATEKLKGQKNLRGQVHGQVLLQGVKGAPESLSGSGSIQLRHANIGELPLVLALLNVLSGRSSDATAFTDSDMLFRIQGRQLKFDQLDLMGDAVSLYGKGTTTFDKQIALKFHSNFRRADLPLPIVRSLVGEASQQILEIQVGGTFDKPQVSSHVLPAVGQALQQFQMEMEKSARRPARFPSLSPWFPGRTAPAPRR